MLHILYFFYMGGLQCAVSQMKASRLRDRELMGTGSQRQGTNGYWVSELERIYWPDRSSGSPRPSAWWRRWKWSRWCSGRSPFHCFPRREPEPSTWGQDQDTRDAGFITEGEEFQSTTRKGQWAVPYVCAIMMTQWRKWHKGQLSTIIVICIYALIRCWCS